MKILAHLYFEPDADIALFMAIREKEAAQVWSLYKGGMLRDAELRADRKGAVLTFETTTEADARALVDTLPAVQAKLFHVEMIPVGPFLSYETLFGDAKAIP